MLIMNRTCHGTSFSQIFSEVATQRCSIKIYPFKNFIRPKKETLVSGNAGDEKNLHGSKFIFLINFPGIFSLVSFAFFVFLFLFCLFVCFLKLKGYILIHIQLCGWVR